MEPTSSAGSRRSSFSSTGASSYATSNVSGQPSFHRRLPTGLSMTPMGHTQLPALSMTGLPSSFADVVSRSPSATSLVSLGTVYSSHTDRIVDGYASPSEPPPGYGLVEKVEPSTRVEGRRRRFSTLSGGHVNNQGRHSKFGPAPLTPAGTSEQVPIGAEGNLNRRWSSVYAMNPSLKSSISTGNLTQRPLGRRWSNKHMDPTSSVGEVGSASLLESDEMDEVSSVAVTESSAAPRSGPELASRFQTLAKIAEGSAVSAISLPSDTDASLPEAVRLSKHMHSIIHSMKRLQKDVDFGPKIQQLFSRSMHLCKTTYATLTDKQGPHALLNLNLKALCASLMAVLAPSGTLIAQELSALGLVQAIIERPQQGFANLSNYFSQFWHAGAQDSRHKVAALQVFDIMLQALILTGPLRQKILSDLVHTLDRSSTDGAAEPALSGALLEVIEQAQSLLEQTSGRPTDALREAIIQYLLEVDGNISELSTHALQALRRPYVHLDPSISSATQIEHIKLLQLRELYMQTFENLSSVDALKEELAKLKDGLLGSSRLSKIWRELSRLAWDFYRVDAIGAKAHFKWPSIPACVEILRSISSVFNPITLDQVHFSDDTSECTVSNIELTAQDLLPKEVTVDARASVTLPNNAYTSYEANKPQVVQPSRYTISVNLKGIDIMAKGMDFKYVKKGHLGASENGKVNAIASMNIIVQFAYSTFYGLRYEGNHIDFLNFEVQLYGTGKDFLYDLARPLIRKRLRAAFAEQIDVLLLKYAGLIGVGTVKEPAEAESQKEEARVARSSDRATSSSRRRRSVLTKLKTDTVSELDEQIANLTSSPASVKAGRRMSMKSWLDETSRQDTTTGDALVRPPVHQPGTPMFESVFEDDEIDLPVEYRTMASSLTNVSRRDTTTLHGVQMPPIDPASGKDLSSYSSGRRRLTENSVSRSPARPPHNESIHRVPMADYLHESAQMDTTTEEAARQPPIHPENRQEKLISLSDNASMRSRMTRLTEDSANSRRETSPVSAVESRSRRSSSIRSARDSFTQLHPAEVRPMSHSLSHAIRQDNTLPETQATGALASDPRDHGRPRADSISSLKDGERLRMRDQLSELSQVDGTLEDNISSPPSYEYQSASDGVAIGHENEQRMAYSSFRQPRRSFTELRRLTPMASFLTSLSMEDNTRPEHQNTGALASPLESFGVPRRTSITSLPSSEIRPMSRRLSEVAKTDGTLERNIHRPPMVDQSYNEDF